MTTLIKVIRALMQELSTPMIFIALIGLLVTLTGCPQNTKPEKGSIKGYVYLDQRESHEGVTVMLFLQQAVSPDLVQAVQGFDTITFSPHAKHFFDHRTSTPIQTTSTGSTGLFEFANVNYGRYIIAYYKEGFGFSYFFDVILQADEMSIQTGLNLYQSVLLANYIQGDFTMVSGRTYLVSTDTYCSETSAITIQDGVNLLISPNTKITINGALNVPNSNGYPDTRISSSSNVYSNQPPALGGSMEILPSQSVVNVSGLMMSYLFDGLIIKRSNTIIQGSTFMHNVGCAYFTTMNSAQFVGNLVINNDQEQIQSISSQTVVGIEIERNMFWENSISLKLELTIDGLVANNYFFGGSRQVQQDFNCRSVVEYNIFNNSIRAIENSSQSNMTIRYNDFIGATCIHLGSGLYNTSENGSTKANFNNFDASNWAVYTETRFYHSGSFIPLDFSNNFWNAAQSSEIDGMIWDFEDAPQSGPDWVWAKIIYSPFRNSRVTNAGIQGR